MITTAVQSPEISSLIAVTLEARQVDTVMIGINSAMTSLGVLISDGASRMEEKPWMLLAPAGTMAVTLLCLNFIGDGLRDALDPKDR